MKITFHGAAKTTTGSMHLLEINGKRILLDCGLYQGRRKEAFERNRNFPVPARSVEVCLLSHAHIDHSGNLPTLVKHGFRGKIYATPPTRDLCEIMLLDSAYLQARDVEYVNKKRRRQGKNPFEPLYDQDDVSQALRRFQGLRYDKTRKIAPGVHATFHIAGHILGSALTVLDIDERGTRRRLLFTGDMGRKGMPILKDPHIVKDVDLLITESTYGNRLHPQEEDVKASLEDLGKKIVERRSRLLIPAFSVGRTQQILYLLQELWNEKRLPEIPVVVDSPLSTRATRVYDDHPECYDREMMALLRTSDDPFSMERIRFTATVEESKALNDRTGPLVLISASGMCEGGRILHHLAHAVGNPKNILLFVGYQAQHTLGNRIVEGRSPIRIYGEEYPLRAEVHRIEALSAHADREELLSYFDEMGPSVAKAFVVHGEPEPAEALADALRDRGAQAVTVPDEGDVFEV
jgi:metallo-beta-lactamase family protein